MRFLWTIKLQDMTNIDSWWENQVSQKHQNVLIKDEEEEYHSAINHSV
jgi:hypothetical protein